MGIAYNTSIVRDGLVLYLDAANKKSYSGTGTVWKDLSGLANNGTLVNGVGYSSDNKGTMVFDGVDDTTTTLLSRPSPSTQSTTYDIIFKYNSNSTFRGLIGASAFNSSGFSVGFMGNTSMRFTYNAASLSAERDFNYISSTITHGTFIFDGRSRRAYRNTSLMVESLAAFDADANASGIRIGGNLQGGWNVPEVDIFSVKVYDRSLTQAEINQNFEATRGRYGI
jgi:hypothetical protein